MPDIFYSKCNQIRRFITKTTVLFFLWVHVSKKNEKKNNKQTDNSITGVMVHVFSYKSLVCKGVKFSHIHSVLCP